MATRSAQKIWPQPVDEHSSAQDSSTLLATSPPSKQALRSWWGKFKKTTEGKQMAIETRDKTPGIFGVPLRESIPYANVAISLVDVEGKSYIYGYVPIIVAKCGVYLKEKATNVEGIFRLSGAEKRIKELKTTFDTAPRYGKGLDWDGYTVHDAANVLRRYLNQLPEPIVPFDLYEKFRAPLRNSAQPMDSDLDNTIKTFQKLITELPPLNIQLLLYILDLLAVFASKADENRMPAENLAAIFQPGLLRHPQHDMAPAEYKLSQDVIVFLINNQDHFLIGMRGTAADEKTVQEVQSGTPPPTTPSTPKLGRRQGSLGRSASTASAGADSARRGVAGMRRNVSINSRHSRQSNGAPSPASPAYVPPISSASGVYRSNTVPSKKSPGLPSARLQKFPEMRAVSGPFPGQALTPLTPNTPGTSTLHIPPEVIEQPNYFTSAQPTTSGLTETPESPPSMNIHQLKGSEPSQEPLIEPTDNKPNSASKDKEKGFVSLFGRSPGNDTDKKPPNKLRKKRIPGSTNPSAQSSATSLENPGSSPGTHPIYASYDMPGPAILETIPSMNHLSDMNPGVSYTEPTPPLSHDPDEPILSDAGLHIAMRPDNTQHSSEGTVKPKLSSHSLKSGDVSATDHSDMEMIDDSVGVAEQTEKRRRWRLSRVRRESNSISMHTSSPKKPQAAESSTSFATTSSKPRKSVSGDPEPGNLPHNSFTGITGTSDGSEKEKKGGPIGWIKEKMREVKEEKRARDLEKEHGSVSNQGGNSAAHKSTHDLVPTPDVPTTTSKPRDIGQDIRKSHDADQRSRIESVSEETEDPTLAADVVTAQPHMIQILEEANPVPSVTHNY